MGKIWIRVTIQTIEMAIAALKGLVSRQHEEARRSKSPEMRQVADATDQTAEELKDAIRKAKSE
jgi:hypothetical protein